MNQNKPKLFLFSLLLPFFWLSLGTFMDSFFPDVRLGTAGLVLVLYLSIAPVSWLLAKHHGRYLHTNEMWRLGSYMVLWAVICESLALWYAAVFEPGISLSTNALLITVAVTAVLDSLFVFLGLKYAGKKIFNSFASRLNIIQT